MWWCPFPSQWSDAGAAAAPVTATDELAAGSLAEVGVQVPAPETPNPVGQTRRAKTTRSRKKKKEKAAESCAALQVPGSEEELSERSEPSSVQGESDSFIEDLVATAEGVAGPAALASGIPVEDVVLPVPPVRTVLSACVEPGALRRGRFGPAR